MENVLEIELLSFEGYKMMEWKNKRGMTREIEIFPKEANLDSFEYRLSTASFDSPGQFSFFPGMIRYLFIVSGQKISLSHKSKNSLVVLGQNDNFVHSFSGDDVTESFFPDDFDPKVNKIVDFNFIVNPLLWDVQCCDLVIISGEKKGIGLSLKKGSINYMFCVSGSVSCLGKKAGRLSCLRIEAKNDCSNIIVSRENAESEEICSFCHVSICKRNQEEGGNN